MPTTTQSTTTPPNTRPPSFDAKIMAYRPGLINLAYKFGYRGDERDDLVTDTIIYCLEHWQSYREDGGLWMWLFWKMRGIVSAQKRVGRIKIFDLEDYTQIARTPPNQEDYADLSTVLAQLSGRSGDVLLRRSIGCQLEEIGKDIGVSRERVRQIEEAARAKLMGRVG